MAVNYKVTNESVTNKDLADIFVPIKNTTAAASIGPGANETYDMRNLVSEWTKTIKIPRLTIDSNGLVSAVNAQRIKIHHYFQCQDIPCTNDDPGGNDDAGDGAE